MDFDEIDQLLIRYSLSDTGGKIKNRNFVKQNITYLQIIRRSVTKERSILHYCH
jgi:hypothetical protein